MGLQATLGSIGSSCTRSVPRRGHAKPFQFQLVGLGHSCREPPGFEGARRIEGFRPLQYKLFSPRFLPKLFAFQKGSSSLAQGENFVWVQYGEQFRKTPHIGVTPFQPVPVDLAL